MRKILFISPLPPPEGGIATWTKKIFEYGFFDKSHLLLVNTRIRGKRNIFDKTFLSITECYRTLHILISVIYQLISNRPQITHINCSLSSFGVLRDYTCGLFSKILGIPIITQYHGNIPDFKNRLYGLSQIFLERLVKISNINIVTNQFSYQAIATLKKNNPKIELVKLPNFIQDNVFEYHVTQKMKNTKVRAIYAGGITKAKGCLEILSVAKLFPEIDFHLFGKLHADVASDFKKLTNNVFIHKVTKHQTLLQEMQASDFLIFPSYTEGFPLAVLEAMAMGLPIIATQVGAIPEMIDEGKGGYLVEAKNVYDLARAIKKIAIDPALRAAMGSYNRDKAYQQYRYSVVVDRLVKIYDQVMHKEMECVE